MMPANRTVQISTNVLFAVAIFSVVIRFFIRIFGRRNIQWDDGLVLLATITLATSHGILFHMLNSLYLQQAIRSRIIIPFREDIPRMIDLSGWMRAQTILNMTSFYLIKVSFMAFFYPLILGHSMRVKRFYWSTVGMLALSWLYTFLNPFIVCPYVGADICIFAWILWISAVANTHSTMLRSAQSVYNIPFWIHSRGCT
jgi:hypothetical protein